MAPEKLFLKYIVYIFRDSLNLIGYFSRISDNF